jgi:acetyl-CoA C-acetyltransferase
LVINPSGGLLCSNPGFGSNLVRIAEAAEQVRGTAGARQVPEARTALAFCVSGLFKENASAVVLRST